MNIRAYQERIRAQLALQQTQEQLTDGQPLAVASGGNHYQLETLLIAARNDIARMRELPTLADRAVFKKEKFLPQYLPFVEEYLKNGEAYQNDILGYCIVFLFDVGEIGQALQLAEQAIAQQQKLPENFKSELPAFVAEQVYQWADKTASTGQSVEPYFSQTFENVAKSWTLHEIALAKWLKLTARLIIRNAEGKPHAASVDEPERLIQAVMLGTKAFQLNPKAGVKDLIERSLARLNQLQKEGLFEEFPPLEGLTMQTISIEVEKVVELLNRPPLSLDEVKAQIEENRRSEDQENLQNV